MLLVIFMPAKSLKYKLFVSAANKVDLWTPKQPNEAAAGQYCGYMDGIDSAFTFSDEKCDNSYYYVCQLRKYIMIFYIYVMLTVKY